MQYCAIENVDAMEEAGVEKRRSRQWACSYVCALREVAVRAKRR